jgi:ribonuclease P protein subunit RPR2
MEKAKKIYSTDPDLANKYADLSRRYSMSVKISFPIEYKKLICKKCKKLMIPGKTCRTRIQSRKKRGSRYVITCLSCNNMTHIYFKRKDKKKTENEVIKVPNKTEGEL